MRILFFVFVVVSFLFSSISLDRQITTIQNIKKGTATINIGNLQKGQSGIIVHNYGDDSIILTQAVVVSSGDTVSKIKFVSKSILEQPSLATSKLKPSKNDIFVLNHLYKSSLLIAPNIEAINVVKRLYTKQNFIGDDFFASYLKLESMPLPTKEVISQFCLDNQIGTIFFVIAHKLYIVDSLSFKVIDTKDLEYSSKKIQVPFYTNIKEIKKGFWDFGEDFIKNYDKYYSKMIGIKNDR